MGGARPARRAHGREAADIRNLVAGLWAGWGRFGFDAVFRGQGLGLSRAVAPERAAECAYSTANDNDSQYFSHWRCSAVRERGDSYRSSRVQTAPSSTFTGNFATGA